MSSRRRLATNAIALLTHADILHVEQGLELLRAQDHSFRQQLLRELLAGGYRQAAAALLVAHLEAAAAHDAATDLARWAVLQLLGEPPDPQGVRALAANAVREAPGGLGPVAAALARDPSGQAAAAAVRALAKLQGADPADFPRWSRLLQRVLDAAFWSELQARRGPLMRELERRCAHAP